MTSIAPASNSAQPGLSDPGEIDADTAPFSREEILAAITTWHARYGEIPRMIDWEPSRARRCGQTWRAERFEQGRWPSVRVVRRRFGTFNAAVEAAGLTPRPAARRIDPQKRGAEAILYAFRDWTRRYGDIPTMADWDPARARQLRQEWRTARYYDGDWPSARAVATHFGSFANAATAAGLVPRAQGTRADSRDRERWVNRLAVARTVADETSGGPEALTDQIRTLARARSAGDPVLMHMALIDLAAVALAWAGTLTSG